MKCEWKGQKVPLPFHNSTNILIFILTWKWQVNTCGLNLFEAFNNWIVRQAQRTKYLVHMSYNNIKYIVIFLTTYFKSTQISATALSPNVSWYLTTFSLIWKLSIIRGYQDQDEEWKQCAPSLKYLMSHSNRWKHSLEGRVNEWSQCEIMIFPKVSV